MYIEPNTNIHILKNVPLDTSYEHTIYFSSLNAQQSYFLGKSKFNLNLYSYQRVGIGKMRVGIQAEQLYDCNYLMFQNAAFGTKWFYAYIKSVEYINNVASEITFEIDVMQTWHFDYTPDICFVEREHSLTDAIGEHIEAEPVDPGEYVFMSYDTVEDFGSMHVLIAIVDTQKETVAGKLYDGIYGGATLFAYPASDTDDINAKVNEYVKSPNSIIAMYMVPSKVVGSTFSGEVRSGTSGYTFTAVAPAISAGASLDGYVPKNNKLYTYPYNFYHVDNANGAALTLRYEFFDRFVPTFEISSLITQPIQMCLRPVAYKGTSGTSLKSESLQVNSFPTCSWNTDYYAAWTAQNTIPTAVNAGGGILGAILPALFTGNGLAGVTGALGSALGSATKAISNTYTASITADIVKGNANNGNVNSATHSNQFYGGRACLTKGYAKRIDDFFSKFGYSCCQLKIPNRNGRPHWNYVKTVDATITGSVPCDDMKKICTIYNNGVTFWNNGDEVGNYALNNAPGGGSNA